MKIHLNDKFWNYYRSLIGANVVPYQWRALNDKVEGAEPSHAIKNFEIAAGLKEGEYYGAVFQDSDVYKWIEMTSYTLSYMKNEDTLNNLNYVIELIEKAQEDNGYLNTYYQLSAPDKKWTNLRDHHELYCAGHLIEAAVAAKENIDDDRLLNVSKKFVKHITSLFGSDKQRGYPGHQEIEIGLLRAYEITREEEYLELADYFIKERGASPHFFDQEMEGRDPKELIWNEEPNYNFGLGYEYQQAHTSIYNQKEAVGHAVRAVYYYSSIARLLKQSPDTELFNTIRNLWDDITYKKMYVTGAIGSNENGESFGNAYDLPNDTMYCETCASIGLIFFANELLKLDKDARYAEIIETILYNSALSGMNINGDRFFYVNPLEINMENIDDLRFKHVEPTRQKWLSVACCPPNLGRLIASLEQYVYQYDIKEDSLYINQYIGSQVELEKMTVELSSHLPYENEINIRFDAESTSLPTKVYVRKADWMDDLQIYINDKEVSYHVSKGYIIFEELNSKDEITLKYSLEVKEVKSNPKVTHNIGRVALKRGVLVYCIEAEDNGKEVLQTIIPKDVTYKVNKKQMITSTEEAIDYAELEFSAKRIKPINDLYYTGETEMETVICNALPYHLWANRSTGNMTVWITKEQDL